MAQYLGGPHCRAEHVAVLSALAAFGIVRPSLSADPADLGIVAEITRALRERLGLEAAGAPHEAATAATAAGSRPGPTLPRFGAAAVDLRSFAELASLLQLEECLAALTDSSNKELETALQRVFAQPHSLNPVPVGAWAQPKSGLDVYHHWLTVILPSLRLCWDGLRTVQDVTSMTHLGRHVLHYFEVERSDDASMSVAALEVPASAGEHGYFNNKLRMTYWGCPQLAHVWGDLAAELDASSSNSSSSAAGHSKRFAFSWRALLPGGLSAWRLQQQQQSMDMDAEWGTGAQHQHHAVFSLDMPRRSGLGLGLTAGNSTGHALAQHRKRAQAAAAEGSTGVGTGAARKRAKAGADPTDSAAAAAAGAAPVLARNAAASIANYNHPVRIDPELRRMEKRIFASTIGDGDGDGNGNGNDDAEGHAGAGGTTTCTQGEREGEMEGEMEMDSEVRDRELNQEQGGTETGAGAEEEGQDGDEEGDSQLEEEVRGLHELDEVEWTAKQVVGVSVS